MEFAGIDRWRGGWVVARQHSADALELWSTDVIADALERLSSCACVAIDIPIALATSGVRRAESELRAVLGASARSVFTSPTRVAVEAPDQASATRLNRAAGGPGISAQSFGLFGSIREVRDALAEGVSPQWFETHPETAFALMNDGVPLASKRSAVGVAQRLAALRGEFADVDDALLHAPAKVPIDDALDALAALWSARRIATGQDAQFGPNERDDQGFALGIRI